MKKLFLFYCCFFLVYLSGIFFFFSYLDGNLFQMKMYRIIKKRDFLFLFFKMCDVTIGSST